MSVLFGRVHEATLRMLQRAGLSVTYPPSRAAADRATRRRHYGNSRELAKRNIAAFERSGADVYVVNAAGCGSAPQDTPNFLRATMRGERAAAFSSRVRDVTEVLDAMELGEASGSIEATATYQEACHLVHAQRIAAAPRRLLNRIPGLRLAELEESACSLRQRRYLQPHAPIWPRGYGGKVDAITRTGATIIATTNPGCVIWASPPDCAMPAIVRR